MTNKKFKVMINTVANQTTLDDFMNPFAAVPRACILLTMNEQNEMECSLHCTPALDETLDPVPATHVMVVEMYAKFCESLSQQS